MSNPATFAAVAATVYAAHQAGDYWVQTSGQAADKGLPGWPGRLACAEHVFTYTATLAAFLWIAQAWTGMLPDARWAAAGLALSAVTHYFADRRKPLAWLAGQLGKRGFFDAGTGLATGAALLDQAWHWMWLFGSALLISGPPGR